MAWFAILEKEQTTPFSISATYNTVLPSWRYFTMVQTKLIQIFCQKSEETRKTLGPGYGPVTGCCEHINDSKS